ncbi:septum site-determining protein MinC [Acinetobacter sp. B5B]|uniref:septum site-determining protein MinC n=1 Tax=Acinetobacter baretiae TaxID=2605383 RepID=UPI0018C2597C|nr:septum site-determining protein MinC [Acinetobacter baretiae]MBF7683474.1 septum site-determining protein MinC [Acinetobacter baretiae]MBF7684780.1 septum site-determining protein MinC [Acinetobacter baretiae]
MADIRVTGRMVNFSRLTFDTNDENLIRQQLTKILDDTAAHGTVVILDTTVKQELISLIQLLVSLNLQPMAVIDGLLSDQAKSIQFPILPADRPLQRIQPTEEKHISVDTREQHPEKEPTQTTNTVAYTTCYHNEMLRTGQCLIQEHGDVILNASMNSGSEVISSGNIYIYGGAKGRVIAGASGDTKARIFCQALNAELISIAGTYCIADDIPLHVQKKAAHIYLNEEQKLVFEALEI